MSRLLVGFYGRGWVSAVEAAVVSWLEELERREAAARERAEELRWRIGELSQQLVAAEEQLSRLAITRETMLEILGGPVESVAPMSAAGAPDEDTAARRSAGGAGFGWFADRCAVGPSAKRHDRMSVLPTDYRDILEVLADSGRGLRTAHVAAALGLDEERSTVESLRSKLKQLTARGWLDEAMPGMFTLADGVDVNR
ncbi:hypothetical protein [Nocardia sp. NPDC059239]|uniref:hypothetical protein n=1 Tax=Nocardia sp. NPDC059239 TaxID=3346785 RepID=UPI0036BD29B9